MVGVYDKSMMAELGEACDGYDLPIDVHFRTFELNPGLLLVSDHRITSIVRVTRWSYRFAMQGGGELGENPTSTLQF